MEILKNFFDEADAMIGEYANGNLFLKAKCSLKD